MSNRDYIMARVGVAVSACDAQREILSNILATFADPEEDKDGAERAEMIASAQMMCHEAMTALSFAFERMESLEGDELVEGEDEPTEEGEDDDDDESGDDDEGDDES